VSSEDAGYPQQDEETLGALLQSGIGFICKMRSVVGRRKSSAFGQNGAVNETPIFLWIESNLKGKNFRGQCLMGSFCGAQSS